MPTLFSIDELTTPVTSAQVKATIYKALAQIGINTTSWKPSKTVNTMITAWSIVLAAMSKLQTSIARSSFLEMSEGAWLTLTARNAYGVERFDATFAAGMIALTNSGGGVFSFDPGDVIFTDPSTGAQFRNTLAFALGASGSGTAMVMVAARAVVAGKIGGAAAGAISNMETQLLGVSCTNPAAFIGSDVESDSSLRERCYEKLGSLSPMGPWDAYAAAARNSARADGTVIGVTRVWINKDGAGSVFIRVATADGPLTPDDLDAVASAIAANATPVAVTAEVMSATAVPLAIAYEVWSYDDVGIPPEQIQALIELRIADFVSALPIGGTRIGGTRGKVFVTSIGAVIGTVLPEIFHVVVSLPSSDVPLDATEVAVLDGAPTCLGIHLSARPEGFGGAH